MNFQQEIKLQKLKTRRELKVAESTIPKELLYYAYSGGEMESSGCSEVSEVVDKVFNSFQLKFTSENTITKSLKGVPFFSLFDLQGVGLEYEIELALFLGSAVPTACNVIVVENLVDCLGNKKILATSSKGYWVLQSHSKFLNSLLIDRAVLNSLLRYYKYNFYLNASITDDVTHNLEIRTHVHTSVIDAVLESNWNLTVLRKVLLKLQIPKFLLLTPGFRLKDSISVMNTKHLNLSLNLKPEVSQMFPEKTWRCVASCWMETNYPNYFRDITSAFFGGNPYDDYPFLLGIWYKQAETRMHLKLPYALSNYKSFFEGFVNLPKIDQVAKQQDEIEDMTTVEIGELDIQDFGLVTLGYCQGPANKWKEVNLLV